MEQFIVSCIFVHSLEDGLSFGIFLGDASWQPRQHHTKLQGLARQWLPREGLPGHGDAGEKGSTKDVGSTTTACLKQATDLSIRQGSLHTSPKNFNESSTFVFW